MSTRVVNPRNAAIAVFNALGRHLPRGQCIKVRESLPDEVRALWSFDEGGPDGHGAFY
jgi:uncharacterized protein (DUF2267 family)